MSQVKDVESLLSSRLPHSIKNVEGYTHLTKNLVINARDVIAGDRVDVLILPNGKFYLNKTTNKDAFVVEETTLSHIFFEEEVVMEETDGLSRES